MALASAAAALLKGSQTPLQQLLEDINFQRTKEMRQLLKDGGYRPNPASGAPDFHGSSVPFLQSWPLLQCVYVHWRHGSTFGGWVGESLTKK